MQETQGLFSYLCSYFPSFFPFSSILFSDLKLFYGTETLHLFTAFSRSILPACGTMYDAELNATCY